MVVPVWRCREGLEVMGIDDFALCLSRWESSVSERSNEICEKKFRTVFFVVAR